MGLFPLFKVNNWEQIRGIPNWARKVFQREFNKNYRKGNRNPYNKSYLVTGKNYIYKIKVTDAVQGGSYSYYKKRRKK